MSGVHDTQSWVWIYVLRMNNEMILASIYDFNGFRVIEEMGVLSMHLLIEISQWQDQQQCGSSI